MTFHSRLSDYYRLLGVDERASADEIRQAFWRRAKQYHPDRNQSPAATNAFLILTEAYHALRHEKRRQAFDAFVRHNRLPPPPVRAKRWRAWAAGAALSVVVVAVAFTLANFQSTTPLPDIEASSSADAGAVSSAALTADVSALADPSLPPPSAVTTPSDAAAAPSASPEVDVPNVDDVSGAAATAPAAPAPTLDTKALGIESDGDGGAAAEPDPLATGSTQASVAPFPALDPWEATVSHAPLPPLRPPGILDDRPATLAARPNLTMGALEAPAIEPEREPQTKKHARKKHRHAKEAEGQDEDKETKAAKGEKRHHAKHHAEDAAD